MRLLLAATIILLPAYALNAQTPVEGGKPETAKKICKIDPEDTDSRIRRRICKTEAEWNAPSQDDKSEADREPKQAQ
jgi:hypothetical protein